jgi:Xaa-Pro aminopeptidase
VITSAGYPEYGHALGHHVGRTCHDGAGLLGPRWERYGQTPFRKVEPGNVFTLEPSIEDAGGAGCLGIEEMVLVTDTGCQWLSHRQLTLPLIAAR